MIYYKDPIQLRELGKKAQSIVKELPSLNEEEQKKEIKKYKEEVKFWTITYPNLLQQWEDDGGFINERNIEILYYE